MKFKITAKMKRLAAKLNDKQLRFAHLLLERDTNGLSQGGCYEAAGYSTNRGRNAARDLLSTNQHLNDYLNEFRYQSMKQTGLTLQVLDEQLLKLVTTDLKDVVKLNSYGEPEIAQPDLNLLSDGANCALKSIKTTKDGLQVDMYSRLDAMKLAYQRLGGLNPEAGLPGDEEPQDITNEMDGNEAAQAYSKEVLGNG